MKLIERSHKSPSDAKMIPDVTSIKETKMIKYYETTNAKSGLTLIWNQHLNSLKSPNLKRLKQNTEKHINKIKCETKQLKIWNKYNNLTPVQHFVHFFFWLILNRDASNEQLLFAMSYFVQSEGSGSSWLWSRGSSSPRWWPESATWRFQRTRRTESHEDIHTVWERRQKHSAVSPCVCWEQSHWS